MIDRNTNLAPSPAEHRSRALVPVTHEDPDNAPFCRMSPLFGGMIPILGTVIALAGIVAVAFAT